MDVHHKGKLYIICGASGAGKGTVIAGVLKAFPNILYSISCTTRAARDGEIDGKHYYFVSREKFNQMIAEDSFLEYAAYVDNLYGTPAEPVRKALDEGRDVFLEIDVQGAFAVKKKMPEAIMIFIVAPSFRQLESRLRGRGTEEEIKIQKRLRTAEYEYKAAKQFDYIIVNSEIENAVNELCSVIQAQRCRTENRMNYLEGV